MNTHIHENVSAATIKDTHSVEGGVYFCTWALVWCDWQQRHLYGAIKMPGSHEEITLEVELFPIVLYLSMASLEFALGLFGVREMRAVRGTPAPLFKWLL